MREMFPILGARVLIYQLRWKEDSGEESGTGAQENAERIAALENHCEAGGENSETRQDDGSQQKKGECQ